MNSAIIVLLGFLPGFAWLLFYMQEELRPEPKKLIFIAFLSGAVWAVLALVAELALNSSLSSMGIATFSPISLVCLALIEELAKFSAAYFAVHKNPEFGEPVEAMLYMVVAALGFATVENLGALQSGGGGPPLLAGVFATASLRFVGPTLLHTLTSGIVGYFWAISIREFGLRRPLIIGLGLAALLHAVFNYLILSSENFGYAVLFVTVIGFFVLTDFEKLKQRAV